MFKFNLGNITVGGIKKDPKNSIKNKIKLTILKKSRLTLFFLGYPNENISIITLLFIVFLSKIQVHLQHL